MTIIDLYPPIALATLVATLWLIVAHRLYRRDKASGSESALQALWFASAPGLIGAFLYVHGFEKPVVGSVQIFMTSLSGIAMGGLLVFATKNAFFDRTLGRKDRVISTVYLVILVTVCGSPFFY